MIRLPSDLAGTIRRAGTVVVPSRQRAYAARLAYAAAQLHEGARVWKTPEVFPVEGWLTREIERHALAASTPLPRLLSPAEEWLLWRECTAQQTAEWELLDRAALAEGLRRASALAAEFSIDVAALPEAVGSEFALLQRVWRAVQDRCRSLGATSVQSLAPQLEGYSGSVTFAGFLKLPPRLRALGARQPDEAPESHAFRPPAQQKAPQATFCSSDEPGGELTRPRVIIAADDVEELERIAGWCKTRIAAKPDARILIVLPGLAGIRERLAALIRQATDPHMWFQGRIDESLVAIEGGRPLALSPVVAHALTALRWLAGERSDFEAVSEWLRAPYWNEPQAGARARIDQWLRELGQTSLDTHEWMARLRTAPAPIAAAANEWVGQLSRAAAALGDGTASTREWSERFRAALEALHWPGEPARTGGEQQTVMRLHELLDEFGQLAAAAGPMAKGSAVRWFGELAARTAFRPADEDAVVTISSAFADPIVQYDSIWVAGLHAEVFPQAVQPDPFLPLAAQLAARIPSASASGRLEEACALMTAWRAATDELVLSAPARSEDLELLPSPLLAQWQVEEVSLHEAIWLPLRMHRSGLLETFTDVVGLSWPVERALPSGTRSLELQNQCPFRAYAELRLGSMELGVPELGVAADVRGKLLHAALQRLWQKLYDSRGLADQSDTALSALIETSVAEAAGTVLGPAADEASVPLFARELRRTVRLIHRLCELERERAPFRVAETELESSLTVRGARLALRIDRVDVLDGGGRAILDYKSGRRTPSDWYGERPSHPQLLAYLAALGDEVVAMATVNVTAREVRFEGIASTSTLLPKVKGVEAPGVSDPRGAWELRRGEWLARIEHLVDEFLAGYAAVDPKPGACEFCHVASVCRISDRGAGAAPAAGIAGVELGND